MAKRPVYHVVAERALDPDNPGNILHAISMPYPIPSGDTDQYGDTDMGGQDTSSLEDAKAVANRALAQGGANRVTGEPFPFSVVRVHRYEEGSWPGPVVCEVHDRKIDL